MANLALGAGKPVVCEKPLATSVEDARDLTAKATAAALVATVPFAYRLYPTVRESNAPAWRWWSRNDANAAASRSTAYGAVSPLSPRFGGRSGDLSGAHNRELGRDEVAVASRLDQAQLGPAR